MSLHTPLENPFRVNVPREFAMTRFVQPHFAAADSIAGQSDTGVDRPVLFDSSKTMAAMLLAAVLAAMLVVADQLIDTWADGHLLVVWVLLWVVTFAALSVLIVPLRRIASLAMVRWDRWSAARSARRAEEEMWRLARDDYRLMADLRGALTRNQG
jgi:hypothetical protein